MEGKVLPAVSTEFLPFFISYYSLSKFVASIFVHTFFHHHFNIDAANTCETSIHMQRLFMQVCFIMLSSKDFINLRNKTCSCEVASFVGII